jgi:hypothetical protein
MFRVEALKQVNGYNPQLIAGEEPELCFRLRERGWLITRVDADMTLHDADMTRFGQWWKRSVRAGHAFAEGASLHGSSPERYYVRESRSIWIWGFLLPAVVVALAWPTRGFILIALLSYALLFWRIRRNTTRRGISGTDANVYAASCTFSKFPEIFGQLKFLRNRLSGRRSKLIEYKRVSTT